MKIQVEKPTENHLKSEDVSSWPIWEKEVSRFDWGGKGDNVYEIVRLSSWTSHVARIGFRSMKLPS